MEHPRDLHKFILGELRTDGWKSLWRIEQERRRTEEMGKRMFVALKPKRVQIRVKSKNRLPNKHYFKRQCDACGAAIRDGNKTGRCIKHKLKQPQELKAPILCGRCDKQIRKGEYGLCKKCYNRFRRQIHQHNERCKECGIKIRLNTKYGLCRTHSRAVHSSVDALRKKMKRHHELARAA